MVDLTSLRGSCNADFLQIKKKAKEGQVCPGRWARSWAGAPPSCVKGELYF